ncbi:MULTISPECIES: cation:dicarboxylase symporter family transporter [unclassified Pseudonocardia]|uniref:cation:dicarboxylate symporter family transporter n=1 Tax=unclassified Pseudonocardia TaxID=2619320 RepID=UPI0002D3FDA7|nr:MULTISPECIES: cation:dicarboxylase symporter family transporter [unclassified Pseudonocardia]OLM20458.1 sodium:dicarboxylate symporter [Pseudonocardia sp. Ae707_Ps1]
MTSPRRRRFPSLFVQVLIGIALGIATGLAFPGFGSLLAPLGEGFIKLIKMVVAPLIFLVIVTGIAKVGSMRALGSIGVKALGWFTVATLSALTLGLVVGNLVQPGAGMNIDPATLDASSLESQTQGEHLPGGVEFVLGIIPTSVFSAFADNNLLQVLLFALLFGVALAAVSSSAPPVLMDVIDQTLHVIFKIVGYVMYLAPLGAFGAMAATVADYGAGSLTSFGMLVLAAYGSAVVFIVLLSTVVWLITGVNAWKFLRYCKDEFMLALGTGSSEAVMPRIISKLTGAGCDRAVVGLVVPTGYSFNLDGAAIYLSLAMIFLSQAVGADLTLGQQIVVLGILMLSSKGMAGVPGSAFVALSATAAAVGAFPVAAVALLLGADRLMDSMRVFTNLLGNCLATFVVARWEGMLDRDRMRAVLDGRAPVDDEHEDGAPEPAGASDTGPPRVPAPQPADEVRR